MSTVIPCKRPKVTIDPEHKRRDDGLEWFVHRALCHVPGCSWLYDAAVKSDAEWQAKHHRAAHRDAVPKTSVDRCDGGCNGRQGYIARCECGWTSHRGIVTRSENESTLEYHLRHDHGLVSCS